MAGGIEADAASGVAFSRHDGIYRSDVLIASCKPGPAYRVPVGSGPGHEARRKETRLLIVATSSDRLFLDRVGRHHCPSPLHRHSQFNMQLSQAPAKGDISTLPAGGHFYFALTGPFSGLTPTLGSNILRSRRALWKPDSVGAESSLAVLFCWQPVPRPVPACCSTQSAPALTASPWNRDRCS